MDKLFIYAQNIIMKTNFPQILRTLMEKNDLNQLQLAILLGVRQSQVSNWLNGKSLPGYYSIRMICKKLKIQAEDLLEIHTDEW